MISFEKFGIPISMSSKFDTKDKYSTFLAKSSKDALKMQKESLKQIDYKFSTARAIKNTNVNCLSRD